MKTVLILSALLSLVSTSFAAYQLDLKQSIDRIQGQINVTKHRPPQWDKLDRIIDDLLECLNDLLPPAAIFNVQDAKWMPATLTAYVESLSYEGLGRQLQTVDWPMVTQAGEQADANLQTVWDDLKEFMKTPEYGRIHLQIYRNVEFLDLLKFLHSANYEAIYIALRAFYTAMDQPNIELPDGPNYTPPPTMYSVDSSSELPQGAGNRIPTIKIAPPSLQAKCDPGAGIPGLTPVFDIIQRLNDSNIHEVIKVLLYILQEVLGNSAMHVLLLKLGENQKGAFFRDTIRMPEMQQGGIVYVQNLVFAEPGIAQMNDILRQVTGLDMRNRDLFSYVTNLIMYLVWGVPFPPKPTP